MILKGIYSSKVLCFPFASKQFLINKKTGIIPEYNTSSKEDLRYGIFIIEHCLKALFVKVTKTLTPPLK